MKARRELYPPGYGNLLCSTVLTGRQRDGAVPVGFQTCEVNSREAKTLSCPINNGETFSTKEIVTEYIALLLYSTRRLICA